MVLIHKVNTVYLRYKLINDHMLHYWVVKIINISPKKYYAILVFGEERWHRLLENGLMIV